MLEHVRSMTIVLTSTCNSSKLSDNLEEVPKCLSVPSTHLTSILVRVVTWEQARGKREGRSDWETLDAQKFI